MCRAWETVIRRLTYILEGDTSVSALKHGLIDHAVERLSNNVARNRQCAVGMELDVDHARGCEVQHRCQDHPLRLQKPFSPHIAPGRERVECPVAIGRPQSDCAMAQGNLFQGQVFICEPVREHPLDVVLLVYPQEDGDDFLGLFDSALEEAVPVAGRRELRSQPFGRDRRLDRVRCDEALVGEGAVAGAPPELLVERQGHWLAPLLHDVSLMPGSGGRHIMNAQLCRPRAALPSVCCPRGGGGGQGAL